jgi:hypothetical protein
MKRRHFVKQSALASLSTFSIIGSQKSIAATGENQRVGIVIGEGEHRYEVIHDWAILPEKYKWQITHNVAVDRDGFLYVIHEGQLDLPDHPAIFVFDTEGRFVRAFGQQFQGGGHGLEVRDEDGEQFLYVTGYLTLKFFAKLTLQGETVWERRAPMESGLYVAGEDSNHERVIERDRFLPTNFAFLDDGGFLLADGYGSHVIHRYDKDANWVSKIGTHGKADGEFNLPHGLWIDRRGEGEPSLVVADRSNGRVQWLTLDGAHIRTENDFLMPANVDQLGDLLLIPDLSARITLVEKDGTLIHLAEDAQWRKEVVKDNRAMRTNPSAWKPGKFVHPHDACFDANGDIYVAEWVTTGRISKLRKVS